MEERGAIVVGAGITGLAAALELGRRGVDTVVLEAAERAGGSLRTYRRDGWLFELGPNTVLEKGEVPALLADSGLEGDVLAAAPIAKRRYLWKGDRLQALPASPPSFLTTGLFPVSAKLRLLAEPFVGRGDGEESIADFVRRRLGRSFLDYAVGPFVSGVYAGDPERLSVRWAVPKIAALERDHGSLIRGAVAKRRGPAPGGRMIGFPEGFEQLVRTLVEATSVRTGAAVETVTACSEGFEIVAAGERLRTSRLLLAVPSEQAAELLATITEGRSSAFAEVPYAPVVVVGLGFRREDVAHSLDGFGFLAPRVESLRLLGCLFTSSMFPERAPEGHVALTAFAGGRLDPEYLDLDDDAVLASMADELGRALGVSGDPVEHCLHRWPRAIPQYEVGHGRFVELAASIEAAHPGLAVAGNFVGGVSVPDCIARGRQAASRLV